ncbi:MAG TPA: FAD-dependent oxidoreductase, partial [Legionellaceae bacterium]|nr:FAD-dependent oxidoreductase [Legionellaceae bacterium]
MKDFDVIIIGAGPAATAAAIHGAMNKLNICIVEREVFPREHPGETLAPGLEPLFKQLGVLEAIESQKFIRHSG